MFDFHLMISYMRKILNRGNLHDIKVALPEGFIQTRVVATNYKAIRNIYYQRINHRMKWWKTNLTDMLTQLAYPEFIEKK
jgi:transposase-like protein